MKNAFAGFIIATAALCSLDAVQTLSAKAEITRGTIGGYQATVFQSGSYSAPDYIEIVGPRGKETISVTCAPYDWKSTGPNTAAWVGSVASQWCNS
jgi:hypothetical protein